MDSKALVLQNNSAIAESKAPPKEGFGEANAIYISDKAKTKVVNLMKDAGLENEPSYFEMTFYIGDTRYRYGFEVSKNKVDTEWLFSLELSKTKESILFTRTIEDGIDAKFKEGKNKDFQKATRPNALFLSALAQFNGEVSKKIQNWFKTNIIVISGIDDDSLESVGNLTIHKFLNEEKFRSQIIAFFKAIKIGFDNIDIVQNDKMSVIENRDKFYRLCC